MVNTCPYAFVQTHRMYKPRVNSKVNYTLGVIMMCPCGFSDCSKRTTLWCEMSTLVCRWGQGGYRNFLFFLLNFSVNIEVC